MSESHGRKLFLICIFAGTAFLVACCSSRVGGFAISLALVNARFKDGKAYIAPGAYAVDGTYGIERKL